MKRSLGCGVEKGNEQEAADEAEVQQQAQEDQDSAVWRITDGKGAAPDVAATTPAANRMAAGRLDFMLQVMPPASCVAMSCERRTGVFAPVSLQSRRQGLWTQILLQVYLLRIARLCSSFLY